MHLRHAQIPLKSRVCTTIAGLLSTHCGASVSRGDSELLFDNHLGLHAGQDKMPPLKNKPGYILDLFAHQENHRDIYKHMILPVRFSRVIILRQEGRATHNLEPRTMSSFSACSNVLAQGIVLIWNVLCY